MVRISIAVGASLAALCYAGEADAQLTIPVLQPVIPFNYSRGRNVSVSERDRPEYQAIGIDEGGFTIYPRIDIGVGFTDNVFETDLERRPSAFFSIVPTVKAVSNWSQNSLQIEAGGDIRRFTAEPVRDQDGWHVSSSGRYDLGADSSLTLDASTAKQFETRFSGSTPQDIASATPYQISVGQLTGTTQTGPIRLIGVVNFTNAYFSPITLLSGTDVGQGFRDRNVITGSGQAEYSITPSTSVFAQVSYTDTNYYSDFATGLNDRSSTQIRGLVGLSFDISALVRGSFGIGYSDRRYETALYDNVKGVSLEARFEYFPSELTTVTIAGRRAIEDSTYPGSPGYFNSGVGVQVDHEFFRNVLFNLGGDFERDDYRGIDSTAKIYAVNGGVHYLFSRTLGVSATVSYGRRHNTGVQTGPNFGETSGLLSFYVQR